MILRVAVLDEAGEGQGRDVPVSTAGASKASTSASREYHPTEAAFCSTSSKFTTAPKSRGISIPPMFRGRSADASASAAAVLLPFAFPDLPMLEKVVLGLVF
jgi:hypothetical protein